MKTNTAGLAGCFAGLLWLLATPVFAGVSYTTPGATYAQNFDTLAITGTANPWVNDVTLSGWYWVNSAGTTPTTHTATNGSGAAQDMILSLGAPGSTDRALGSQTPNTGTADIRLGLRLVNDTGETLTRFTLLHAGEQWRNHQQRPS
jgi:hypothetical protein